MAYVEKADQVFNGARTQIQAKLAEKIANESGLDLRRFHSEDFRKDLEALSVWVKRLRQLKYANWFAFNLKIVFVCRDDQKVLAEALESQSEEGLITNLLTPHEVTRAKIKKNEQDIELFLARAFE